MIGIAEIKSATAIAYGLTVAELEGPRRLKAIARARHAAIFLCREILHEAPHGTLTAIGAQWRRDHTTILNSCRRIEELCRSDPAIVAELEKIRVALETGTVDLGGFILAPIGGTWRARFIRERSAAEAIAAWVASLWTVDLGGFVLASTGGIWLSQLGKSQ